MNLSELAAHGTALDLAIAEAQGKVTVKKLPTRKPRRGETWGKAQGGGSAIGAVRATDSNAAGVSAGTNGARMTLTQQRGYGAEMVANLAEVTARYASVKAAEHREAAREEAALRRAAREAEAAAALDSLLDSL